MPPFKYYIYSILIISFIIAGYGKGYCQSAKVVSNLAVISDSSFQKSIKENQVLLADFYETYCGACRMQALIVDSISNDQKGKIKVIKVDVDKNKDLTSKMQVSSYPTILLYKNGKQVWRSEGIMPRYYIMEAIKNQN